LIIGSSFHRSSVYTVFQLQHTSNLTDTYSLRLAYKEPYYADHLGSRLATRLRGRVVVAMSSNRNFGRSGLVWINARFYPAKGKDETLG
jgi:hypothetical protein